MPHRGKSPNGPREPSATTRREETPALEGREPLPEELTGRASGTAEDLAALFDDGSGEHMADGFRGGSDDDEEADVKHVDTNEVEGTAEVDDEEATPWGV